MRLTNTLSHQTSVGAEGVLSAIGRTPLARLTKLAPWWPGNVFAKLEGLNPGGSIKDRPALSLIRHGMETGLIRPDTLVIESSSGNMGIGLAQACGYFNLRFICVIDPKTTEQNKRLLEVYGAEIDLVSEGEPATGDYLCARLNRVKQLLALCRNSFWPSQYSNIYNPIAHHQTMREIAETLESRVDYLFCATSTCGTLRGCAEYVRENKLNTRIIAVDAVGSVIFCDHRARRLIPGHGASVRPALYHDGLAYQHVLVSDVECVIGCRRLIETEAILTGGSSGAVVAAFHRMKDEIPLHANCAMIFPDRGERYLDTIYSDTWVEKHFGDISPFLERPEGPWRPEQTDSGC
jgi:N-(2-amino-2-carboxyethyl)-L-glutamate synthase